MFSRDSTFISVNRKLLKTCLFFLNILQMILVIALENRKIPKIFSLKNFSVFQ